MADLLFVAVTIAFFALAAGFVVLCDRIIGPDSDYDLLADGDVDRPADVEGDALEGAVR